LDVGLWRRCGMPMRALVGSAGRSRTLGCARSLAHRPPSPRRPAAPILGSETRLMSTFDGGHTIREVPVTERPRERLALRGVGALTAAELIGLVWGSGTRGRS